MFWGLSGQLLYIGPELNSFDMKRSRSLHKGRKSLHSVFPTLVAVIILTFSADTTLMAQEKSQMVRLAKIKVDPTQVVEYNAALKEQMTNAVRNETGVLTYYAVSDKSDPSNITILEIYTDTAAYKAHIETPHFKKYKETVKNMVKSLELVDVTLIGSARKEPGK